MKTTGIIKHIDALGRFKIPKELLTFYDIKPLANLRISKNGKNIVLGNYKYSCIFSCSTQKIHVCKGKSICKDCIKNISHI